jgi:neutral ceramidase
MQIYIPERYIVVVSVSCFKMTVLKKIIRYVLLTLGILIGALLIFVLAIIIPIDRTPAKDSEAYSIMMTRLDSLDKVEIPKAKTSFRVGFGMANLTPTTPIALAGYGNRRGKTFTSVHDSIYVRSVVIDNGTLKVAMVTADLLIIPPRVTEVLTKELPEIGFSIENTFLGATHTHNSIGDWAEGATQLMFGEYDDRLIHFIVDKIKKSIVVANADLRDSKLKVGNLPLSAPVRNRLHPLDGTIDSLLRVMEIHRADSSKGILLSYTAHATCLFSRDLELSRDYPGTLVDDLEQNGYDFAMFMAGAVGSHGCNPPQFGWKCLNWMSDQIVMKVELKRGSFTAIRDTSLVMVRMPLALPEPQVKISKDWRIRPWVFEKAFGVYQPYLTALRIGDLIFLGTPCDFSGELTGPIDEAGHRKNVYPIVTSFNGHYIGYITRDDQYDTDHYETRLMNWYGPGNGAYLSDCLVRLTEAVAH